MNEAAKGVVTDEKVQMRKVNGRLASEVGGGLEEYQERYQVEASVSPRSYREERF